MKGFIYICCIALFFIIILAVFHKNNELFSNNKVDIFTDGKCCSQKNIDECNKYGQSGVCNYQQNNKSCLCQNSF
jgi:hypothetical protein